MYPRIKKIIDIISFHLPVLSLEFRLRDKSKEEQLFFIKNCKNINSKDMLGNILLNIAIAYYPNIIDELLEMKIDINNKDFCGFTPLMFAINKDQNLFNSLLKMGQIYIKLIKLKQIFYSEPFFLL